MPEKHLITLYEVESDDRYYEHWLAESHLDAARLAILRAPELGMTLDRVEVSTMVPPEDLRNGGLVYVWNNTRTYAIERGRLRRVNPSDDPAPGSRANSHEAHQPKAARPGAADFLIRLNRQPVPRDYVLQENDRITCTPTKIEGA